MRLIWLGGAWLAGVAMGGRLLAWWPPLLCAGLALPALAGLHPARRRALLGAAALLAMLMLGAWRAGSVPHIPADLPPGRIEAVRGRVEGWPERGNEADRAIVAVEEVLIAGEWRGAAARLRADLPLAPAVGGGDRVELAGSYRPGATIPLAGFRDYLRRRGLHGQFRAHSARVIASGDRRGVEARRVASVAWIEERLRRAIPQPEAALVSGILLGNDNLLPPAQRAAFDRTGTSHIMALSGWNIAIVAGLCALAGRRLGWARSWPWLTGSAGAIWGYTLLVGGGASLVRAAIMGTLYLVASATGRRGDALTALVVAAVAMTAARPATIFDLGFQLSCAATLGLILCAGPLARRLRRLPPLAAEGLAATVAAEVFTLPLVLHQFGRLSTVTLPANLLIEPLVPAVMAGGVLTAIGGAIHDQLGIACGFLTWLPARALLLVVERFGALPGATVAIAPPPPAAVFAGYTLLAAALGAGNWGPRALALARAAWGRARLAAAWPLVCGAASGALVGVWLLLLAG